MGVFEVQQPSCSAAPHLITNRTLRVRIVPLTPISGIYHDFVEQNLLGILIHWLSLLCYPVYLAFKT